MNLLAVPVPARLLTRLSRTMSEDLPFALEHRIPVLPVLLEPGLETVCAFPDKFGRIRCLDREDPDPAHALWPKKLKKRLESLLFTRDTAERITASRLQRDGNPEGTFLAGPACLYGIGMETDRDRAAALLTDAVEEGRREAMSRPSEMYRSGNGVPLDFQEAVMWLKRLACASAEESGPGSPETLDALLRLA